MLQAALDQTMTFGVDKEMSIVLKQCDSSEAKGDYFPLIEMRSQGS